ncbi:MAG: hypothetical protein ACI84O_000068 [Myxococcota bacterium]|jgi:hypothetical protein
MLKTLIPIVALLFSACGVATQPSGMADIEHQAFYEMSVENHTLAIDRNGIASFASAAIDAQLQPRLAAAFAEAKAPGYPLIGRDHANWVRQIDVAPSSESGKYSVTSKGLAPYPIRLSLIKHTADGDMLITRIDSAPWNAGTHFAMLSKDIALQHGDVLIVRHEGAKQGFDSIVTVSLR